MSKKRDKIYLQYILECIHRIQNYTNNDRDVFMGSNLVQDGVLRRLQTMAESTQQLSNELKSNCSDVNWRALSGFRNILVHDYLNGIDLEKIWTVVIHDLPNLESVVRELLADL